MNGLVFKNKNLHLFAGTALAFYILFSQSFLVHTFIHDFVNIFAGGRSSIKVYLFAAWAVLILAAYFYTRRVSNSVPVKEDPEPQLIKIFYFTIAFMLIALLANFLANITYLNSIKAKSFETVISFSNKEISSTSLLHSHAGKTALGQIANLSGSVWNENIDTGQALLNKINPLFSWFILAGLVLSMVATIILFNKFARLKTFNIWLALLYTVTSFSILKNIVDGGILNREALVSLIFFCAAAYLSLQSKKVEACLNGLLFTLVIYLISFAILTAFGKMPVGNPFNWVYLMALQAILMFALLNCARFYKSSNKTNLKILTLLLLIVFGVPLTEGSISVWKLNTIYISSHNPAYIGLLDAKAENSDEFNKVQQINRLSIYNFSPKDKITVKGLSKKFNLLPNFTPIAIPWQTCMESAPPLKATFTVLATEEPNSLINNQGKMASLVAINKSQKVGKYESYEVLALINACAPRKLNIIEQLLNEVGLSNFVIKNLQLETFDADQAI